MNKFRVIPQSTLGEEEFDFFPVWSEHYDYEEIEDIVRWGLDKDVVLKMFDENEHGNEHSVYTLLESNPFPERMRIFIKAHLTTTSGVKMKGYIMNENAYCLGVFVNGEKYFFSRHEMLSDLNSESAAKLAQALGLDINKLFPMAYETDFTDKSGNIITGSFNYGCSKT